MGPTSNGSTSSSAGAFGALRTSFLLGSSLTSGLTPPPLPTNVYGFQQAWTEALQDRPGSDFSGFNLPEFVFVHPCIVANACGALLVSDETRLEARPRNPWVTGGCLHRQESRRSREFPWWALVQGCCPSSFVLCCRVVCFYVCLCLCYIIFCLHGALSFAFPPTVALICFMVRGTTLKHGGGGGVQEVASWCFAPP